ncbi:MAG: hypothetical protein ACOC16_03300 [Nanoarchaeota archaeon]
MENQHKEEFEKIKSAFSKVKNDMNQLLNYTNKLQKENQDQNQMIFELRDELLRLKNNKENNNQEECPKRKIIANIESKKFHYDNCPYGRNIKLDNRMEFENIEKAIKSGYQECSCIRE